MGDGMNGDRLPLVEPIPVMDIFADGLGQIERLGSNCARLTLTCRDGNERRVVAKIIVELATAGEMTTMTAAWLAAANTETIIENVARLLS